MRTPTPDPPLLSVVVPTRDRARYLPELLRTLGGQALDVEVCVVDDGSRDETPLIVAAAGVRSVRFDTPRGLNAARNAGLASTGAELVAFVDDDVRVPEGWAAAVLDGAARHPEAEAYGGPIRAVLEGTGAPRGCGREPPPITHLDLGGRDRRVEAVWGANLVVRRSAAERVGGFDEAHGLYGDEEEWLERLRAAGGSVVYLADAGLVHRRAGADARVGALSRAAYRRGLAARSNDERRGIAPPRRAELRVIAGCAVHAVRFRCPFGISMGAEAAGRLARSLGAR